MFLRFLLITLLSIQTLVFESQGFTSNNDPNIVRRAAFDFGSGSVKLQVADVDTSSQKIVKTIYAEKIAVDLSQDLSKSEDGQFSEAMQQEAIRAIKTLKGIAETYQTEAYSGVGTEAFRLSKNGTDLVQAIFEQVGVPIKIISQEEEGHVGFAAAIGTKYVSPEKAVVWDIGGGSLQIVAKQGDEFKLFKANLGKVPMKNFIIAELQQKDVNEVFSPNPISAEHALEAVDFVKTHVSQIPEELLDKLSDPQTTVLGIGAQPKPLRQEPYDREDAWMHIQKGLDLEDEAIRQAFPTETVPAYAVSDLIMVYGIMDAIGIKEVQYVETVSGNTTGVLITPSYWEGI